MVTTSGDAITLKNLAVDRWSKLAESQQEEANLVAFFQRRPESFQVLLGALNELTDVWKSHRIPSQREMIVAIERFAAAERQRLASPITALYERARDLRQAHGDAFLAMFAKPAQYVCHECAEHYVPRGIAVENRYLRHEHFDLARVNADPSLEVAIADARKACPHPLESAAAPMSDVDRARRRELIRQALPSFRLFATQEAEPAAVAS